MYQNIANQNPLIKIFNGYMIQNPNIIPFQNNQLINNNVHVMNNLNEYVQQHKIIQQNIPTLQQQINMNSMNQINQTNQMNQINLKNNENNNGKTVKVKNINIIKNMLEPEKIDYTKK